MKSVRNGFIAVLAIMLMVAGLAAGRPKRGLILSLAITFVALQTCDAFFTMWAMNHGFQEVNPYLAGIAGSWLSPVVKILPAALVSFGVVKAGKRFPVAATVGLSAVVAVE